MSRCRSSTCAITVSLFGRFGGGGAGAQVGQERLELALVEVLVELQVALEHRRAVAAAEAHDGLEREQAVVGGALHRDVELARGHLHELVRAAQGAGQVVADLQHVAADRLFIEEGVEAGQRQDVGGVDADEFGHFAHGRLAQVAVFALGQVHQVEDGRLLLGEAGQQGVDFGGVFFS
jgi:hypothetical protein